MIWVYCCDVNKCWLIDWYSCWETATFACGVRSARERSFEEASGETEVGRRPLTPEPRPLPPWTRPRHANRTPTWSSDLHWRYFAWNRTIPVVMLVTVVATTATLSSNASKFFMHFTSVLRKQFAGNDTFLREANSYELALALRNSLCSRFLILSTIAVSPLSILYFDIYACSIKLLTYFLVILVTFSVYFSVPNLQKTRLTICLFGSVPL